MDRIEISGIRVVAVVGLLPHEREAPQPIRIDLILECDLRDCGRTDEIADTTHYGLMVDKIVEVVRGSRDKLLERLGHRICEVALSFERVVAADVRITKLRPPVAHDIQTVSVCIRRTSADYAEAARASASAIVSIGSNLGNRLEYLRFALKELGSVAATSQVYETEPIGGPENQGAYLNMVAVVKTTLDPFSFLRKCQRIEAEAGRKRLVRWGPRTLDIDVLFYDNFSITSPELTVPHPRFAERRFVLVPLSEVAPERCPPGWDQALAAAFVSPYGGV